MAHATTSYPNGKVLLGLIGAPIKHSASPAMHEAAGDAVGLRTLYQLMEVADFDAGKLGALLEATRQIGFAGYNVTFPYKEAVLPLLDDLSEGARAVGAVNTVVNDKGRLVGHNTDSSGFARALQEVFPQALGGPFCLIGTGGVGKAIAVAIASLSQGEIRIVDTDRAKAEGLARLLGRKANVRVCEGPAEAVAGACGLINGTPIGMLPNRDSPVPDALLRPDMWVADAVYSPLWTPLLEAAKRIGAPVMTGRDLAIHQGLDAFRLFTGREAPRSAMEGAFDAVMKARESRAA